MRRPRPRRAARRIHDAGFPRPKRIEEFDFDANPAINPAVIHQLATCAWVKAGHPLCLIGDSGTGKTHLLIALGTAAAEAGYRVRYTLASKLVNELVEAADDKQLSKMITRYGRVDLLWLDELGYMELDRRGAELLFQVLTEREERSAIAIASNEPFSAWTKTFTDPRLCAAIVDRLTFAGQIIETGTTSYRLAHARKRRAARLTATSSGVAQAELGYSPGNVGHRPAPLPRPAPRHAGPARRLAEHLSNIVRAATAGDAGTAWESALPCRRRPANRRCPGRMIVLRTEPETPIRWQCSVCGDDGVISNWEDSLFDLRRRQLTLAEPVHEIVIAAEVAATLRESAVSRHRLRTTAVFAIRAHNDGAILAATDDDLDELIGSVAAEANHEPNRRRQQRLDAAFDALNAATQTPDGW